MTTNVTKDPGPDSGSDAAIEAPTASEAEVPQRVSEPDLESRIKARRAQLLGKLGELQVDKRREAPESRDRLKARLSELSHILRWGVVDGWASVGDPVAHKLEQWLADSAGQLAAKQEHT
jgi:hypothetical protein